MRERLKVLGLVKPHQGIGTLLPVLGIVLVIAIVAVMIGATPTNPLFPVKLDEWHNESRNLSETFSREGEHYWRYVLPGTYRIGDWSFSYDVPDWFGNIDSSADIELSGYWIAKYPITVQQYGEFINAGGYDNQQYWTDNGWEWREKEKRTQPYWWDDTDYNSDNQPVIGVTWYEASAFASWLNAELADVLPEGYRVQLPTEAEWEVACAYDEAGQRHTYPWGEQEPTKKLVDNKNLGGSEAAAPVGERPDGAAACGAQDMVGSVWEWTTNDYFGYATESNTRVADFATGEDNTPLRGASWWNETNVLLCAARDWYYPTSTSAEAFAWSCPLSLRTNVLYSVS